MPKLRIILIVGLGTVLGSCAGDNPENVPVYGDWEMATKLGSLSIDGIVVPPEAVPAELGAISGEERRCGEPMFIDREWQQDDINRRVRGSCILESYDVSPSRVSGKGKCEGVAPDADFNPSFTVDIEQSAERYRMTLVMQGDATIPGQPGRHVIRVSATQEGTRIGDC